MQNLPVGSLWRRWDLHVHTPGTALGDRYPRNPDGSPNWKPYLEAIEAQNDVAVIGVTDYLSIANYKRMLSEKRAGRLANIALLIPNIEFRITPATDDGRGINIHLLVSPDDPDHIDRIERQLARLSIAVQGEQYSCVRGDLIRLGRKVASLPGEEAAYSEGVNQFKPSIAQFRSWWEGDAWLRRNTLVAVAANQKDGVSGLRDGGFLAIRQDLYQFAHIIFSGRPGDREFWLGKKTPIANVNELGGRKPCVHGSDAHDLERLFKPDQDRFCWIKADTTFEGLRQILFEPEDRVFIGPTPPMLHDEARVITSIGISGSRSWFENGIIELNPGLIAIIGPKGSGKSALTDLISYAAGSWDGSDKTSFINRARQHIAGTQITLHWKDGRKPTSPIGGREPLLAAAGAKGAVKYLSQRFVERLCSEDIAGRELLDEIERVIFAHLDQTDTLNASSFSDLRAKRTAAIAQEKKQLTTDLHRLNREIDELITRQKTLADRRRKVATLVEERDGLMKQRPEFASEAEAKTAADLQAARGELEKAIARASRLKGQRVQIDAIRQRVASVRAEMERAHRELVELLQAVDVPPAQWDAYRIAFQGDTEAPLDARAEAIAAELAAVEGDSDSPSPGTIRALQAAIRELETNVTADEAKRARYAELQKRIGALNMEIERANAEIGAIEGPEAEKLEVAKRKRAETYAAYFVALKREQAVLEDLYRPLQDKLCKLGEQERSLEFYIRWTADIDAWVEKCFQMLDQRKGRPYATQQDMKNAAEEHLLPAWTGGDEASLEAGIRAFLAPFEQSGQPISWYLRSTTSTVEFYEWLYSVEHIALSYGLRYNGTELENLSPGTKGIVLLILYLGMDQDDTRPLLIDQPEENLDNESIFSLLSAYFREAKKRRQIVVITHNPNLVVNTDAEQVIVADCKRVDGGLPSIRYVSGALEDAKGIRRDVCRILEGGEAAFHQREKRYSFD